MDLTRENQLKAIDDGIEHLGITQHRLEVIAHIPVGTIKDLRRGKLSMRADTWQKICRVLFPELQPQVCVIGTIRGGNLLPIDGVPLITYNNAGIAIKEIQSMIDRLKKVDPPPGVSAQNIVAVEAVDESLPGVLPGDFIFYNYIAEKDWDRLVNKRCAIKMESEDYPKLRTLQKDINGFCALAGGLRVNGKIEWVSRYRGTTPPEDSDNL